MKKTVTLFLTLVSGLAVQLAKAQGNQNSGSDSTHHSHTYYHGGGHFWNRSHTGQNSNVSTPGQSSSSTGRHNGGQVGPASGPRKGRTVAHTSGSRNSSAHSGSSRRSGFGHSGSHMSASA